MGFNIAIDGPAGAGKSTIAKRLSEELSFIYVDTGAMYRAMALYFLRSQVSSQDEAAISAACEGIDITIEYDGGVQCVILNGENVNGSIRTEEVGIMASNTSIYPKVRQKLTKLQQKLAAESNVIMDGRDIGTCVLPQAQVKIYLTANPAVRARRRYEELVLKGEEADLAQIEADIIDRDYRDMHREIAPLRQAEDAVCVDTSEMGIEDAVAAIRRIYEKTAKGNV